MTTRQAVKKRAGMHKAVSVRKDPFNPPKAVEEDQVKTMGLGSSVR